MPSIQVNNLRKVFDTVHGEEVAVDDVEFEVGESEFLTLVGPSGCGKTTCLRCVAGLEEPTSGSIVLGGEDITNRPPNKRNIAMMFQSIALYPHMTVRDNIGYPLKVRRVPEEQRNEPVERVADLMKIPDMLDKYPGDLSGGQQQRAALARTVVQEPKAFLMDEPLSDLDAKLKVEIRKEIQRIHKQVQKPVIYVTHDQEEAMTMSDRIAVMNNGEIEQIGTPAEIFHKPANLFVGQFIGNYGMNLIECDILGLTDGAVTLDLEGKDLELEYDELECTPAGDSIGLGFRPEATKVGESSKLGFDGRISLLESFGEETNATIETDYGQINALSNAEQGLQEDADVTISFDKAKAHLFDLDTGNVVAHTTT